MADLTRITVNLTAQAADALTTVSAATGYNQTDTVNRALRVYAIVRDLAGDGPLTVVDADGSRHRIHIL